MMLSQVLACRLCTALCLHCPVHDSLLVILVNRHVLDSKVFPYNTCGNFRVAVRYSLARVPPTHSAVRQ
jgi:hypothetical protein